MGEKKGQGALNLRIASFAGNSERQSFISPPVKLRQHSNVSGNTDESVLGGFNRRDKHSSGATLIRAGDSDRHALKAPTGRCNISPIHLHCVLSHTCI
ncbi:hypothetical protein EVAR_100575_1 [Eumeta japonica]|uniref:Uncharacterized protein n=1 Tax=Eumeta variegata TaxID=151549 RepID=A0A4C1YDV5_EUMVA|nr:hypothetical protein EVAR_100575_1 [Eumeta japonica]